MRRFPAICVDDFYSEPEAIRKFALDQDFCISSPEWPGKRTKCISEINPYLYQKFCERFFSLYYDISLGIKWRVYTTFQLIESLSEEETSYKNVGWIHRDDSYEEGQDIILCSGVLFLTPDINKNCGTSLYRRKNFMFNTNIDVKQKFYGSNIDDDYEFYAKEQYKDFEETIRYYNYFNRLISFDSGVYHGANSFYSSNLPRLTQVFFIYDVNVEYPIHRKDKVIM
jgi:hypothetical protein